MARLNRKDMQEQTRAKLLAAAEAKIMRYGVEAASIRDIAEAAGYSLGAFYSNFESKDAMLYELMERHIGEEIGMFREIIEETSQDTVEEMLAKIASWLRKLKKNKALSAIELELQMYANRNPVFKKKFDRAKGRSQTELAEGLKAIFDRLMLVPKVEPFQMATGFAALWSGFAIQGDVAWTKPIDEVVMIIFKDLLATASPIKKTSAAR